jgi:hypothetical protein
VPIPVFYHISTGHALLTAQSVGHVAELVRTKGTDCWWELPIELLLHPAYDPTQYRKGTDTMDVWFDSGVSWLAALQPRGLCIGDDDDAQEGQKREANHNAAAAPWPASATSPSAQTNLAGQGGCPFMAQTGLRSEGSGSTAGASLPSPSLSAACPHELPAHHPGGGKCPALMSAPTSERETTVHPDPVANNLRRNDGGRVVPQRPADVYVEGSDQHRGWFQSSLLTYVAVHGGMWRGERLPDPNTNTYTHVLSEAEAANAKEISAWR